MKLTLVLAAALVIVGAGSYAAWYVFAPLPATGFDRKSVTIEVFNGCGIPRIARAVADEMLGLGFDVYETGNADSLLEHTAVVDLLDPAGKRARQVATELGARRYYRFVPLREKDYPQSYAQPDSSRYVDLRLVVGLDYEHFFPGVFPLR